MIRHYLRPREDWKKKIVDQGLVLLDDPDSESARSESQTPWREDSCYELGRDEAIEIQVVTDRLFGMCLQAVDLCVKNPALMAPMGISESMQRLIIESWRARHPTLYSRFDLARNYSDAKIKMIEINGDTPTGLIESSLIQWDWLNEVHPEIAAAQFEGRPEPGQLNSLHENLIARWQEIATMLPESDRSAVFSARTDFLDDALTTEYLRDLATQAGFQTHLCDIRDVTLFVNPDGSERFGTPNRIPIRTWFKLYPWEWLLAEQFGPKLIEQSRTIRVIEPAWKLLLSNKAILVLLWQMFPGHENLMPAFYSYDSSLKDSYVIKPQYGRESTGVRLIRNQDETRTQAETANPLENLPPIYQGLVEIESHDGYFPLMGSWLVKDEPCGLMIREDHSRIISGTSRIVPHFYLP